MTAHDRGGSEKETREEKLTRNFGELLQELRVTQTGRPDPHRLPAHRSVLDPVPSLDSVQRVAYLAILYGSVLATGLIVTPVAFHRVLFRQGERYWLVKAANKSARAGLLLLALTTSGVVWLVFDVVTSRVLAHVFGGVALAFFATVWAGVPWLARRR